MAISTHRFRVFEIRKISHPILDSIDKYWLTIRALDLPSGISTAANARDPIGLNRRVYRDVKASLEGKEALPGTFDLMNKGITILATQVRVLEKDRDTRVVEVSVDDEQGGVVDGAHTAKVIEQANEEGTTHPDQYVEVYVRTGVSDGIVTDIARGLNTGMQVAPKSIYNIDGVFQWLKEIVDKQPYGDIFSWKESDTQEYDVRDLIGVLEIFNVFDFPNDGGKHPISAYEKWSVPLDKFADDFEQNRNNRKKSRYYRLRKLLPGGLALYDHIRHDFRKIHNANGGSAGKLSIIEEAGSKRRVFDFPFAGLDPHEYRLTKGATYPILGAFRNHVQVNSMTGEADWLGGFEGVLRAWREAGPELVAETFNATREIGRTPDMIGKNRKHWDNLHMKMQLRLLRAQLTAVSGNAQP
ncbi:MAG: AIPR family protein [Acidobacteriaceae bacterium]|nr:AIPR family protein [Acidobacteriaceae bacterium]MBV9780765.1 AIPR family protein [Acidobacteriaceae bacterium]